MTNLIIIMADQLRQDIVHHTRYPFVQLPNLDRLRDDGVTLGECFSQYPICCPSRASFITGKYPHQLGMWNNHCRFPVEERDLGHHLSVHGYDAVAFGKTHAMAPGFRSVRYDTRATMGSGNHGFDLTPGREVGVFEGDEEDYCDFVAVRQFADYLDSECNGRPFAALLGIYAPHPPLFPPRRFAELYPPDAIELPAVPEGEADAKPAIQQVVRQRWTCHDESVQRRIIATYLGMATLVDDCVGRALAALNARGLLEETLVVFTSDHGEQLGEHRMIGKFHQVYDGSLRVPLIVRQPGREGAGAERRQLVEMTDIFPTLCELLHVPAPDAPHAPAGVSFAGALTGEAEHRPCVHAMLETAQMVRTREWKLVRYADGGGEFYHLAEDPQEWINRYDDLDCRTVRTELTEEMLRHLLRHPRGRFNDGGNGFFG
jgi:arylsulfatase A-like enzyme